MDDYNLSFFSGHCLFEGEYRTKMSELRLAGYLPASPSDIIEARLALPYDNPVWNYVDTDFGIAATVENIYLIPNSTRLRNISPNTRLTSGGMYLNGGSPDGVQIFPRTALILDRALTEKEARESPIWKALAGGDKNKLDAYVEKVFHYGRNKLGYTTMMTVILPEEKEPIERAIVMGRLDTKCSVSGMGTLCGINARFVGIPNL